MTALMVNGRRILAALQKRFSHCADIRPQHEARRVQIARQEANKKGRTLCMCALHHFRRLARRRRRQI
ncbi:MAG TPA: hypothetical protein VJ698_20365 [Noviherbaspirillum sp.]|uniref:hypothetical protein n=1 Tax=Noviherbaspirillum sp. TaxID=1926288 RepID=UPI002B47B166|nr:hypothetical protein [Noviherbaspirillum sp.]HJV87836.1 hypothetical protein [Noviherbaspirillum sp.]